MNSKKKKKTIDTIPLRKKKGKLIEEEHQLKASIYDPKLKFPENVITKKQQQKEKLDTFYEEFGQ